MADTAKRSGGTVTVNGEARALDGAALVDLLRGEGIDPARRGVAVALNGTVVPRRAWAETRIEPGDSVEIVKVFAGG